MKKELEKATKFIENHVDIKVKVVLAAVAFLAFGYTILSLTGKNDVTQSSVMILNASKTGGGTGVIIESGDYGTDILTNAHVCRAIKLGGIVRNNLGEFMVMSYKASKEHDLCLVKVGVNLGTATKVASRPPNAYYEKALISGHPNLLPNVVTSGHFSGSAIIEVMEGIRPCTPEDEESFEGMLMCAFLGGYPIVKRFESTLVTATIMAGSSGSGVYNSDNELSGLAFAGSEGISYAWTVPYESLRRFLDIESKVTAPETPDNNVQINEPNKNNKRDTEYVWEENTFRELRRKCKNEVVEEEFKKYCNMVQMDTLWRK